MLVPHVRIYGLQRTTRADLKDIDCSAEVVEEMTTVLARSPKKRARMVTSTSRSVLGMTSKGTNRSSCLHPKVVHAHTDLLMAVFSQPCFPYLLPFRVFEAYRRVATVCDKSVLLDLANAPQMHPIQWHAHTSTSIGRHARYARTGEATRQGCTRFAPPAPRRRGIAMRRTRSRGSRSPACRELEPAGTSLTPSNQAYGNEAIKSVAKFPRR